MLSMRRERRGSTEETDLENMTIGGAMLKEMFLTGAALLEKTGRISIRSMCFLCRMAIREPICP